MFKGGTADVCERKETRRATNGLSRDGGDRREEVIRERGGRKVKWRLGKGEKGKWRRRMWGRWVAGGVGMPQAAERRDNCHMQS